MSTKKKTAAIGNGSYIIETGIPIPISGSMYPFADMKVGNSFCVPADERKTVISAASNYSRRHGEGTKFSIRAANSEKKFYRVWRVE